MNLTPSPFPEREGGKRDGRRRLPLEGIRVLDMSVVLAGPHAVTLMADWGAECIRVEPLQVYQVSTRGRQARPTQAFMDANRGWIFAYPDFQPGKRPWNRWNFFHAHGRNKLGMTVDMRQQEGVDIVLKLASICDILIENNVPETMEKLGMTYGQLRKAKPDIIYLRMPAYGLQGPYKNFRTFGPHLEGAAGHTYIRGYSDTDPTLTEDVFFGDACAAATAAYAAAIAIRQLRRTGKGQEIDLSQTESLIPYFGEHLMDVQMHGRVAGPQGNDHYRMAPHNAYRCAGPSTGSGQGERWVAIAVGSDEEWRGLTQAMGSPPWANDPRFITKEGRYEHRTELDGLISAWTAQHENRWVMEALQAHGVPAGVLNNEPDAYADPQLNARGFFQELTHVDAGTHSYPGIVWKMARTPNSIRTPPVNLGEHNEFAYKELLGVSDTDYSRLEREGHIGTEFPPHIK